MNHATTVEPARTASPRSIARWVGIFTLLTIIGGVYAQGYVSRQLIEWRDATATATNFLAHRNLALSGLAVYLVEMACSVVTVPLFYLLLKPAGRTIALMALCLGLLANFIKTVARVFFAAPLFVLGGRYVHALSTEALNDLSLVLLLVNDRAAGIAMVFFGFYAILLGVLILRSTFLPRLLGFISILGGLGWLTNLWRPLWSQVGNYVLIFALIGAVLNVFWMLVFGVNEQRWHAQAGSANDRELA